MTDPSLTEQLDDLTNQAALRAAEANILDIVIRHAEGESGTEAAYAYSQLDEQTRAAFDERIQNDGGPDVLRGELVAVQAEVNDLNSQAAQLRQQIAGHADTKTGDDPIYQTTDPVQP